MSGEKYCVECGMTMDGEIRENTCIVCDPKRGAPGSVERMAAAIRELLTVARMRGDLPIKRLGRKLWKDRMRKAWLEAEESLPPER